MHVSVQQRRDIKVSNVERRIVIQHGFYASLQLLEVSNNVWKPNHDTQIVLCLLQDMYVIHLQHYVQSSLVFDHATLLTIKSLGNHVELFL